ncbi:MAG: hypothetical protein FWF09_02780 [Bacteroidales bacterium]|nr:hypothetical protein [Bacteroidales bacterium]
MRNTTILKNKKSSLLCQGLLILAIVMLASACGMFKKAPVAQQKTGTSYIRVIPEEAQPYTTPALKRFMAENEGPSVVVRDVKAAAAGVSGNSNSSKVCALMESGLLKAGYNVRDRQLFENVMNRMGDNIDYEDLCKKTGTDLIFEVIDFVDLSSGEQGKRYSVGWFFNKYFDGSESMELFYKKEYIYDKKGRPKQEIKTPISYEIRGGYHIEIKVIMLRDNKVGGTYKYYYTPCSTGDGCMITNFGPPLRYRDNNEYTAYEKSEHRKSDAYEDTVQEWGNFIANVVKEMDKAMKEGINK